MSNAVVANHTIDLAGAWTLVRCATGERHPATVPGCVHLDLQRAGVIPSPDWRDNEASQLWIGEEEWSYERTFTVADHEVADLVCDGLDTLATVWINDVQVLSADNMHRTWLVAVGPLLRRGANTIRIRFASVLPAMAAGDAKQRMSAWNIYQPEFFGRAYVRKMACAFGWDWGPIAVTAGIWRGIRLECAAQRADGLRIRQRHAAGSVALDLSWVVHGGPDAATVTLSLAGRTVATATTTAGTDSTTLQVPEPQLWWPNGQGAQPLYDVRVAVAGCVELTSRIGLRTIEIVRERDGAGESFLFAVNGRRIFAKGSNWVPHRVLLPEITAADTRRLVDDMADAHMNMIRVWGGGIYEDDAFYDACDERGVLVWQDCAFACGSYPLADTAFLRTVEAEIRDNAARLRHHPSLALWCGNNELEMGFAGKPEMPWKLYAEFFDGRLPAWIRQEDPDTPYWPGSPHSPLGERADSGNADCGDAHYWSVWFGHQPFQHQREWRCRFQSEYGFQSFPDRRTVAEFAPPEERNLTSRMMDYHQRSQMGNRTIFAYGLDWFPAPDGLDAQVHVSQLTQSTCVRYAAEHLRRLQPRNQGCLFWQLNDIWPCASWSAIDSAGRWKVLMHESARFFAPVVVSVCEDEAARTAAIHVSSHLPAAECLRVRWQVTDTDGRELLAGSDEALVAGQSDQRVAQLDLAPLYAGRHAGDLLVWAWAEHAGVVVSRNIAALTRYKHVSLGDAGLRAVVGNDPQGVYVDLSCTRPALFVRLDLSEGDAWWEDNHLHLHPAEPRRIRLRRGPTIDVVREQLRVSSLADLMPDRRTDALAPQPVGWRMWEKR